MKFINISQDKKSLYTLKQNERCVFFMLNRSGKITFELAGAGAEAHIFSFFIGKKNAHGALAITQKHIAPRTTSRVLIKSALFDKSAYDYMGLIHISQRASQSEALQESRTLLLSPQAEVSAKPALEILADNVKCHHAATVSSLNPENLFFAQSRRLSAKQTEHLLVNGFFHEAIEKMKALGAETENIEKTMTKNLC
jgi:Fe-S cluster assembly protein SufD